MPYQGIYLSYSGGLTNLFPNSSLGGGKSFIKPGSVVSIQQATVTGGDPITGMSVMAASGNPLGQGWVIWSPDSSILTWIPYGTTSYSQAGPGLTLLMTLNMPPSLYPPAQYPIEITTDGYYLLGGEESLFVYVEVASLPAVTTVTEVTIASKLNSIFDDVTYSESSVGDMEYRCLWLTNTMTDAVSVKISVDPQPPDCFILVGSEFIEANRAPVLTQSDSFKFLGSDGYLAVIYPDEDTDISEPTYLGARGDNWVGLQRYAGGYQNTDGVEGDLPTVIISEGDPTNLLANVRFQSALIWNGLIRTNEMISFWLKRIKAAEILPETLENFSLKIEYQGDAVLTPWSSDAAVFAFLPTVEWTPGSAYGLPHFPSIQFEDDAFWQLEEGTGYLANEEFFYD